MLLKLLALAGSGLWLALAASAQDDTGLVGRWDFDEGEGDAAHDSSGHGNHGALHGPGWVKRAGGSALAFDGADDWVDCGSASSLDLTEAVTIEAWVYPEALPAAEPMIVGKYYDSFGLTHYRDGRAWFYISGGGNNASGPLEVGAWNHLVATFDGATMTLWANREKVVSKPSKAPRIQRGKNLIMGALLADPAATDPGYSGTSYWRGRLDDVRLYNRPLAEGEVLAHYKAPAGGFGVDTTWFDRLRVVPYYFRDEQRLLVTCDCSGVFPRPADASLEIALLSPAGEALLRRELGPLTPSGQAYAAFDLGALLQGETTIHALLKAPSGLQVEAREPFRPPTEPIRVPSPEVETVPALAPSPGPAPYRLTVAPGGGFTLEAGGRAFRVESSYSYPHGGENRLLAAPPDTDGEPTWQVKVSSRDARTHEITARGGFYSITRRLHALPNRISVQDTIRNETDEDLGVIVDNRLDASGDPFVTSAVAGYPNATRRQEADSPTTFVAWDNLGIGLLPLDDVYVVHSTVYAHDGRAGVLDDKFGLAPRAAYTLEWAIYPCASSDYYDFINAVRRDEGRTGTVEGGFAFVPRAGITREYLDLRGLRYGSFGCLTNVADDPQIEIEGIDFLWLPQERARIRDEFNAIRAVDPSLKLMFHIAHSLISTNKPAELFPDSRVVDAQGTQALYAYDYEACAYFSRERHEQGWRWYIYYPTPGNSFHDALLRSVDVMIDDIGCTGAFMDGFMFGYGSRYTYDRWDGHTVEIDPGTKTIKAKPGSVLLLSQPSMIEYTKRMVARGAVVVANGCTMTRSIGALPLIVDQECRSGPDVHLAQTPCALGNPAAIRSETDIYRDVLDKLKWGNLYLYYGEGSLTYPSLPREMYPITVETIHSGIIRGKERIITSRSGAFGWPDSRQLHCCSRFNPIGLRVPAEFVTTVDAAGARTQVRLDPNESAVLKRLPVVLQCAKPVNLIVERYDARGLVLSLNGTGRAELLVRSGDLAIKPGRRFGVTTDETQTVAADENGLLRVPLTLRGPCHVTIEPAMPS